MDTIVNIPDRAALPSAGTLLPGELPAPPPARLEAPTLPEFDAVAKPPPPPPTAPHGGGCLRLGLALALVLVAWVAGCCTAFITPALDAQEMPGFREELVVADPLNDMVNVFMGQGVEQSDQSCLPCFFRDTGRMRRATGADEAFIAYKADGVLSSFAVRTHVFHPHPGMAAGVGPMPFSFWTAGDEDRDGQPDEWTPVAPQYRGEGSSLGWERGVFFSGLPSKHFLKIVFHDMEGSWRPQVGHVQLVRLMARGPQPTADPPQPTTPATEEAEEGEKAEEEHSPLDAAVAGLVQMIASMNTDADPADLLTGNRLVRGAGPAGGANSQQPLLQVVGDMRPVVKPAVDINPAEVAMRFPAAMAGGATQVNADDAQVNADDAQVNADDTQVNADDAQEALLDRVAARGAAADAPVLVTQS